MSPTSYNRSISGPKYIWKIFTARSLAFLAGFSIGLKVVSGWFLPSDARMGSVLFGLAGAIIYTIYLAYLRFGKPAGYDSHVIRGHFAAKNFRPGRRTYIPPVRQ